MSQSAGAAVKQPWMAVARNRSLGAAMMLNVHERTLRQLETRLSGLFKNHIDLSDVKNKDPAQVRTHFLSRALAALYVCEVSGLPPDQAGSFVTDGGKDGGIDAIYYQSTTRSLFLVQSKWRDNYKKGLELGDWIKFKEGITTILNNEFSDLNDKIKKHQPLVEAALYDGDLRVVGGVIQASISPISDDITKNKTKFEKDQNQYQEDFISIAFLGLSDINSIARTLARSPKINIDVLLRNWGEVKDPFGALYGTVAAIDIAKWGEVHKDRLLSENLRFVLEKSDVNDKIVDTIRNNPTSFWYYNNGITAICDEYRKKPVGGTKTDTGVFEIKGVSIVNGAQTVGAIRTAKAHGSALDNCWALIRFISLDGTPDGFAKSVTQANNTQNPVQPMDFAALDENQERLREELAQMGVAYAYRRGEILADPKTGFDLRSATIALACANDDLKLAVYAKRYISGLWEDTTKEPYTLLFNPDLSAQELWNLVRVMRIVDRVLENEAKSRTGRDRLIAVHSNRFILHCVTNKYGRVKLRSKTGFTPAVERRLETLARTYLKKASAVVNDKFADSYPGNVFKNQLKQQEIKNLIY